MVPANDIRLLGLNGAGSESGNSLATPGATIPLLQDTVSADVWGLWEVTYRDVVILDTENRKVGVFNLTQHDLADPAEYAALREMLLDAAGF